MESVDVRVLRAARDWQEAGHRLMLATVVKTWGSSPRPVGSMMVLREDGRCIGSVSGGCIEDDLIHRYTRAYGDGSIPQSAPELVRYGVTADEAHRFGLPCGGTLELLLEFAPDSGILNELVRRLETGQLVQRTVDCASGAVTLSDASAPEALHFDGVTLSSTLGPQYRLLLIGAGQLSRYVAEMARLLDFEVLICDPRKEFVYGWEEQHGRFVPGMPDDAVLSIETDERTAIVALTHDPRLDDMALLTALNSRAFYVGALGSRVNSQKRRENLAQLGLEPQAIERLHGPIGLHIGSHTPAEIALSVMSEIVAIKNGIDLLQKKPPQVAAQVSA